VVNGVKSWVSSWTEFRFSLHCVRQVVLVLKTRTTACGNWSWYCRQLGTLCGEWGTRVAAGWWCWCWCAHGDLWVHLRSKEKKSGRRGMSASGRIKAQACTVERWPTAAGPRSSTPWSWSRYLGGLSRNDCLLPPAPASRTEAQIVTSSTHSHPVPWSHKALASLLLDAPPLPSPI
jgi:hypothetical protein